MKKRIFLGLAPLFLLLVAMGSYAMVLFAKLGSQVDVILRENFQSVLASQEMKESMERIDSALIFALAGEVERGKALYEKSLPSFKKSLQTQLANVTLSGERELAERLKQTHEEYTAQAEAFWKMSQPEERRKLYFDQMLPESTRIRKGAEEIISINQNRMIEADRQARHLSSQSVRYMAFALLGGVAGAVYFAHRLQRSILKPIEALKTVSKELGEGNLDQVVPVASQDELGELADAFNKMATKLRNYRQVMGDQILQARQMTEITFSAFPDPIIALSPEGQVDFKNPAATRFLYQVGQQEGLPPGLQEEVARILKGEPDFIPTSFERVMVFRVEDLEVFMLPRVIGMRDDAGLLFGVAVILQDVTRLRLLDEVKTNLVSTVSHELKTPLTSVRMGLHLLLEERIGTLNPKQLELLLAAREDSERLLLMINDLLDLAKLESGKADHPRQTLAPEDLIRNVEEDLRALAESRGSRFLIEIEPNLYPVAATPRQIGHILSNFVSNAIKYTLAHEEIILRLSAHKGEVRFSVIDHGVGIPAEYYSQVFERFFRIPMQESNGAGAGLGLAIAKEIVTALGGTIGVESTVGEGSEFYFQLPAAHPKTLSPGDPQNQ